MNYIDIDPHVPMIRTQFHKFIDTIRHCPGAVYFHETVKAYLKACDHDATLSARQIEKHKFVFDNYWHWKRKNTLEVDEELMAEIMKELCNDNHNHNS